MNFFFFRQVACRKRFLDFLCHKNFLTLVAVPTAAEAMPFLMRKISFVRSFSRCCLKDYRREREKGEGGRLLDIYMCAHTIRKSHI
jgi:hypothetical protein